MNWHRVARVFGVASPHLMTAIKSAQNEVSIARQSKQAYQRLREMPERNLRVHLGCGGDVREDWLNIDLPIPQGTGSSLPDSANLVIYDLRQGLPLPDNSCDYIYSSHFFEHLEYAEGVNLMRDCYRCLGAGGVFRAALPNLAAVFRAYLADNESHFADIDANALATRTPRTAAIVDWINYGVYQFGEHKCIYDEEKLILVLRDIGFSKACASEFKMGIDVNSEMRKTHSFYVEAVK